MSGTDLQRPFERVDDSDVYVSYPRSNDKSQVGKAPRVILLFGWLDAKLSHLHKYTEMYHKLYPSATQILVRTYQVLYFSEPPTNKRRVLPVVKLLHEAGIKAYDKVSSSGLLVHSISNGGALAQTCLALCLADTRPAPSKDVPSLPAQALVYDSLPSTANLFTFFSFLLAGVSSPPIRLVAKTFLIPAYAATVAYRHIIDRRPDNLTMIRNSLSDTRLFPQLAPQVYIYGDKDDLTPVQSVENYVTGLKERLHKAGLNAGDVIATEKYIGSSHVSHAKNDPKRYWAAVVKTWEASHRDQDITGEGRLRCKL